MDSLYAQYMKERTEGLIIEVADGFATYRYLDNGTTVYIVDIFTVPSARKSGLGSRLADQIAAEAKERGCTEMIGSVMPSTKGSTTSLKILLAYGMELKSAGPDAIILRKDL